VRAIRLLGRALGLMWLAGCASGRRPLPNDVASYIAAHPGSIGTIGYAIAHGCLFAGMPQGLAQFILGSQARLDSVGSGPGGERTQWTASLGHVGRLQIRLQGGTLVAWRAQLQRDRLGAWKDISKSRLRRIRGYADANPTIDDEMLYAMLNGCPAIGMDSATAATALGAPDVVDAIMVEQGVPGSRWRYRLSLEGGWLEMDWAKERVIGWWVRE